MNKLRMIGLAGGMACLLATAAWAQTSGSVPLPGPASPSVPAGRLQKVDGGWRSSSVIGTTVYNDDNQSIGTIDDLIVGPDGKVSIAVISVGGFLGIGAKLVAVPFDQLHFDKVDLSVAGAPSGIAPGTAPPRISGTNRGSDSGAGSVSGPPPVTASTAPAPVNLTVMRLQLPGASKTSLMSMQPFSYGNG